MVTRPRDESSIHAVLGMCGLLGLVVLHFLLRPWFSGSVHVDLLLIAVTFAVVGMRPGGAVLVGLSAGLALDALSPASFGAGMLALVLTTYGVAMVTRAFFTRVPALYAGLVFAAKVVFASIYALLTSSASGAGAVVTLVLWSLASALLTAGVAFLLRVTFQPPDVRRASR